MGGIGSARVRMCVWFLFGASVCAVDLDSHRTSPSVLVCGGVLHWSRSTDLVAPAMDRGRCVDTCGSLHGGRGGRNGAGRSGLLSLLVIDARKANSPDR